MTLPPKSQVRCGAIDLLYLRVQACFLKQRSDRAFFKSVGKLPDWSDLLVICVIDGNRSQMTFLNKEAGTGSSEQDFILKPLIIARTSSIVNKSNWFMVLLHASLILTDRLLGIAISSARRKFLIFVSKKTQNSLARSSSKSWDSNDWEAFCTVRELITRRSCLWSHSAIAFWW